MSSEVEAVVVTSDLVLQGKNSDERLKSSAWEFVDCWR